MLMNIICLRPAVFAILTLILTVLPGRLSCSFCRPTQGILELDDGGAEWLHGHKCEREELRNTFNTFSTFHIQMLWLREV